jgi:hypothetical protein
MKKNLRIKTFTLLIFLLLISPFCSAQSDWGCLGPMGEKYLDGNNINALIKNNGTLFL